MQPLVTGSSYLPGGPLTSLNLGNGTTETRAFDARYVPQAIELDAPTPRRWSYRTDGAGNIPTSASSPESWSQVSQQSGN